MSGLLVRESRSQSVAYLKDVFGLYRVNYKVGYALSDELNVFKLG